MKKLLVCQKVCPVIAEKDARISELEDRVINLSSRISMLVEARLDEEKRIMRAKAALWGDINE